MRGPPPRPLVATPMQIYIYSLTFEMWSVVSNYYEQMQKQRNFIVVDQGHLEILGVDKPRFLLIADICQSSIIK